jgi:hypothetical protein
VSLAVPTGPTWPTGPSVWGHQVGGVCYDLTRRLKYRGRRQTTQNHPNHCRGVGFGVTYSLGCAGWQTTAFQDTLCGNWAAHQGDPWRRSICHKVRPMLPQISDEHVAWDVLHPRRNIDPARHMQVSLQGIPAGTHLLDYSVHSRMDSLEFWC